MNKRALAANIAAEAEFDLATAEAALDAVVATITAALERGERIPLPGFGTFETRERAARTGRSPQTGEPIEIAASVVPAFKPAAALKRAVSGN